MRTELISIATATHPLDAAKPYTRRSEQGRGHVLPRQSDEFLRLRRAFSGAAHHRAWLRFTCLFNRRGHDSASTYDSRECVGGAYQTVAEGIEDNELAAR